LARGSAAAPYKRGITSGETTMEHEMIKVLAGSVVALALLAGPVLAQTPTTKVAGVDAAVEAKFKAADKNTNGFLDGAELDAHKANLVKIDTDKDGKVSLAEFAAASKAGVVK
jgi:hypothetical protein